MVPNSPWGSVFFLAYFSGLRSGELYGLKWEDVDFKENIIHVRRSYDWKAKSLKRPKSGEARMVDISAEELRNYLMKHKERNFSTQPEYVFSRSTEWEKGKAARAVKAVLEDLGYKPRKDEDDEEIWPNFHSYRASFTMNLLIKDTPLLKVQKILGHLDLKTTQHYLGELDLQDIQGTSKVLFEDDNKKKAKLKAV
jgi:integrase